MEVSAGDLLTAAQSRALPIVRALAEGLVVDESDSAAIALGAFAQGRTETVVVPADTPLVRGFPRLDLAEWVRVVSLACELERENVASILTCLGTRPVLYPLFAHQKPYVPLYAAVLVADARDNGAPVLLAVPRSAPDDSPECFRSLVRRVRHVVDWATLGFPAFPGRAHTRHTLLVGGRGRVYIPVLQDAPQRALRKLLQRADVAPPAGWPAPAAPPPPRRIREPSHRHDAPIQFLQALFSRDVDVKDLGSAQRKGKRAAAKRGLDAVRLLAAAAPRVDAAGVVEAAEAAERAAMEEWADQSIATLALDPEFRIPLPPCAALSLPDGALPEREGASPGASALRPSSFLAASLARVLAARHPLLRTRDQGNDDTAAAPGGVAAAGALIMPAAPVPVRLSVRGARSCEVFDAARQLPPRNVGDVPGAVLPCQAIDDLSAVRAHVMDHTQLVPRVLTVPLAAATGVGGMAVDVDGCGVNLRDCPAPLLRQVEAAVADLQAEASAVPPIPALAEQDGELAAILRRSINSGVDAAAERSASVLGALAAGVPAAAILRGDNAGRPTDLALAAAASLLYREPVRNDAVAAVDVVWCAAMRLGVEGVLGGQLVAIPASGSAKPTRTLPTVNPAFARACTNQALLLPAPSGSATEPVRVVVVGAAADDVARCTRDVLAALIACDSVGSVGVARAAGLPTRGPNDDVIVGGGGLVPLAILVLLLVRHATAPSSRPFAFIKL